MVVKTLKLLTKTIKAIKVVSRATIATTDRTDTTIITTSLSRSKVMKLGLRIVALILAMAMCSCLAPQNTQMVGVDMQSWDSVESIQYDNIDTISLRNINIALRYNDNFRQASLPLKIVVTTPDARRFEEVIELQLQHPHTALTVATTESLPYRADVLLNQKGLYTFSFEPQSAVRGMEAIGIELYLIDN